MTETREPSAAAAVDWTLQYLANVPAGQEEGPANAPLPPTPIVGNGAYQNPISGQRAPMAGGMAGGYSLQTGQSNNPDDMEHMGVPPSDGEFLRNSLAAGWNNLVPGHSVFTSDHGVS